MFNKKRLAMMAVAASMVLPTNLAYLSLTTPVFADETDESVSETDVDDSMVDGSEDPEESTQEVVELKSVDDFKDLFSIIDSRYLGLKRGLDESKKYKLPEGSEEIVLDYPVILNNQKLNLDLGGHTLKDKKFTSTVTTEVFTGVFILEEGADLTLSNGSVVSETNKCSSIIFTGAANFVGDNLTFRSPQSALNVDKNNRDSSKATRNGAGSTVKLTNSEIFGPYYGLQVNGNINPTDKETSIYLEEVNIHGDVGIYQAGTSKIEVVDCEVDMEGVTKDDIWNESALEIRAGTLIVKNSKLTGGTGKEDGAIANELQVEDETGGSTTYNAGISVAPYFPESSIDITVTNSEISGYAPIALTNPRKIENLSMVKLSVDADSTLTPTGNQSDYQIGYTDNYVENITVDFEEIKVQKLKPVDPDYPVDPEYKKPGTTFTLVPTISDYELSGKVIVPPTNSEEEIEIEAQDLLLKKEGADDIDPTDNNTKGTITFGEDATNAVPGGTVEVTVSITESDECVGTVTGELDAYGKLEWATVSLAEGESEKLVFPIVTAPLSQLKDEVAQQQILDGIKVTYGEEIIPNDILQVNDITFSNDNSGTFKLSLKPSDGSDSAPTSYYVCEESLVVNFSQEASSVEVTFEAEEDPANLLTNIKFDLPVGELTDDSVDSTDPTTYVPDYDMLSDKVTDQIHEKEDPSSPILGYKFKVVPVEDDEEVSKDESQVQFKVEVELQEDSVICLKVNKGEPSAPKVEPNAVMFAEIHSEGAEESTLKVDDDGNVTITAPFNVIDENGDGVITGSEVATYIKNNSDVDVETLDVPETFSLDRSESQSLSDIDPITRTFTKTVTATEGLIDISKLADVTFEESDPYYLENGFCTPKVTVKIGSTSLKEDEDYTVTYESNDTVGVATVVITGTAKDDDTSGYIGTIKKVFTIVDKPSENPVDPGSSSSGGGSNKKPSKPKPEEPAPTTPVGTPTTMYRLYNKLTGEHLYTTDKNERDNLLTSDTWKDEGQGWIAPSVSDTPVYRLLNPNTGDHHYTTDKNEFDTLPSLGWVAEGVAFFSADKNNVENVILHRLYNPNAKGAGSHHYTADTNERDTLVEQGWKYEGTAWAGLPAGK